MKKSIKTYISLLAIALLTFACGGGDDGEPEPPVIPPAPVNEAPATVADLIFPSANLLCIDNNITFDWSDAIDPDGDPVTYRITIARDRSLTQIEEMREVANSQVTITLEIATAFYWNIVAIDNRRNESDPTATQAFFTEGDGIINHAPFTAALVAPENESSTVASGTTSLTWTGADTDVDDVLTFDIFFGTEADTPLLQEGVTAETFDVTTQAATTYFWRIDTTDASGTKTIGQIWSFTTN